MSRVTLVVLAVLVAGFVSEKLRCSGVTPVKLPAGDCNADLGKHVYSPERLRVVEACTAVTGRVVSIGRSSDGDLHFAVDPDRKSVLNLVNVVHTHGDLLVEVVCEHIPSDGDARAVCAGFNPQVLIIPNSESTCVSSALTSRTATMAGMRFILLRASKILVHQPNRQEQCRRRGKPRLYRKFSGFVLGDRFSDSAILSDRRPLGLRRSSSA